MTTFNVEVKERKGKNTIKTLFKTDEYLTAIKLVDEYNKGYGEGGKYLKEFPKTKFFVDVFPKMLTGKRQTKMKTTIELLETVLIDCGYWNNLKDNKHRKYLFLYEYSNSKQIGLYSLNLRDFNAVKDIELWFGTLPEIKAITTAMIKIAEN